MNAVIKSGIQAWVPWACLARYRHCLTASHFDRTDVGSCTLGPTDAALIGCDGNAVDVRGISNRHSINRRAVAARQVRECRAAIICKRAKQRVGVVHIAGTREHERATGIASDVVTLRDQRAG